MVESTGPAHRGTCIESDPPHWIASSQLLAQAYSVAASAHGAQRRASDGRYFLEHVLEVATLLHEAGFDDELVAVGLLHDSVERGSLDAEQLRSRMGASICSIVLVLSEDANIASFDWRKEGLRRQVESAGGLAVTVYAADKLSDIRGLSRGIQLRGDGLEERLGTSVASMIDHYRESVEMIESVRPGSVFLPDLRAGMEQLEAELSRVLSVG
ncbi:MAG: HD domain-containing protein [Solirubrobacterales bacterium]